MALLHAPLAGIMSRPSTYSGGLLALLYGLKNRKYGSCLPGVKVPMTLFSPVLSDVLVWVCPLKDGRFRRILQSATNPRHDVDARLENGSERRCKERRIVPQLSSWCPLQGSHFGVVRGVGLNLEIHERWRAADLA